MTERLAGLCCIGCGKIEVPRPCIGVCEDRRCDVVRAADFDDALAVAEAVRTRLETVRALVRRLAWTTPRAGEWESSYRALQAQAREVVDELARARGPVAPSAADGDGP